MHLKDQRPTVWFYATLEKALQVKVMLMLHLILLPLWPVLLSFSGEYLQGNTNNTL